MRIEAFTAGKDPAHPEANEDRLVVLPGRLLAVLDGVSARSPARHDGMLSGQFAAALVQRVLECGPREGGLALVGTLTRALADADARLGLTGAPPALRPATTMALALERDGNVEVILVGDSGVRIDGAVHRMTKVVDDITTALRLAAWHRAAGLTDDPAARDRLSRAVVMHGTAQAQEALARQAQARRGQAQDGQPGEDADWTAPALRAIADAAMAECAARFPAVPADVAAALVRGGIVHAQGDHQNNPDSPLGYGCLDGTAVPERFVGRMLFRAPRRVELFTDGYFAPGEGFGIAAWEARFAQVEREDPLKTGRHASVRGSIGGLWSDDRSYLGLERESRG